MPEIDSGKKPRLTSRPPLVGAVRRRAQRRQDGDEPTSAPDSGEKNLDPTDGEAATPRPTGRRMLVDLFKPSRAQALLAVILCLCAMATVWQVRSRAADQGYSQMRRTELVALLDQLNTNSGQLRKEIAELEATKQQLQTGVNSSRVASEQAKQRVAELGILAGTAPATGPGITVQVSDPQGHVGPELLLDAIEEMRDAGGEAIDLNGIRIVANSWLGRSSQGVVVDGQLVTAPFVLTVIGDPQTLEEGARFRGGLVSQMQAPKVGAQVTITRSEQLTITSLHSPKQPQFARPA